jgi:hypothetical protein
VIFGRSRAQKSVRYHVAATTTAEFAAEALPFTILIFVVSGESRHGRAACSQCITQQASGIGWDGGPARATAGAAADESGASRRECLRRIHDELRNAAQALTTRDLAERIMRAKALPASDDRSRELIQKTVLG